MQCHKGISKTLHANTNGAMPHIASASFGDGVVVNVNDTVEVVGNNFGHVMELFEVVFAVGDEGGEGWLQTAVSSGDEYSTISGQRLEDLIVPRSL